MLELTHSQYAIPLLDQLFQRPVFQSSHIRLPVTPQPSRQAISSLLRTLRDAGILKVIREGRGRLAQGLALTELINLCEGKDVI